MPKTRNISKEDSELFRQSVGKVKPVKNNRITFERKNPPRLKSKHTRFDDNEKFINAPDPYTIKANDKLSFKRPGIQLQLFRKLKRGQIPVEMELDLHGLTSQAAKNELLQSINYCYNENIRCIRIIHGKGKGSENNLPILKNNLNQWLPQITNVLAFCSAQPFDGGLGAIYVLIKKK